MIQIQWQDRLLTARRNVSLGVRRIIFRSRDEATLGAAVQTIATAAGLDVANEHATPQPGDFWLGCSPRLGWGQLDPDLVGWACSVEVPLALSVLRAAAVQSRAESARERVEGRPGLLLAVG
ncbi:hypothetical protein [Gemmata sp.]|uniref:hypothetical protein n=1 Tax=Gemmata sp. TaxID=1914242 RepID=UPI003F6FB93E